MLRPLAHIILVVPVAAYAQVRKETHATAVIGPEGSIPVTESVRPHWNGGNWMAGPDPTGGVRRQSVTWERDASPSSQISSCARKRTEDLIRMRSQQCALSALPTFDAALEPVTGAFEEKSLKVPFDKNSIHNASHHGGFENWHRVHRALWKLLEKKGLTVLVFGASVTCQTYWVRMLKKMLKQNFENFGEIKVINKCAPGTTHKYALEHINQVHEEVGPVDIVISEYHYNEFVYGEASRAERTAQLSHSTRLFMSTVMAWPSKPAFMFLDIPRWHDDPSDTVDWLKAPAVASGHWSIANEFHVPLLWYSDAVRASGSLNMPEDPKDRQRQIRGGFFGHGHPSKFPGHHVMAALVYGTLHSELLHVCEHGVLGEDSQLPAMDAEDTAMTECIAHPQFEASAFYGAEAFKVDASFSTWTFFEDVRNKPGWIAASGAPQKIVFKNINVERGIVKIGYLRSYENVGDVTCQLKVATPPEEKHLMKIKMQGLWDSCSSQIDVAVLTNVTAGTYDLSCLSDGQKFKIVSLMSC